MLFSILIAQYNNGNFFEDCYKSIIAQTFQNFEVIIVDDASADGSVEQMRKLIGEDDRFKIFQNEKNEGCGYTKRRAADLAKGEICAFLDPDDAITPDALTEMVQAHIENPDAAAIYSRPYLCDEKLSIISLRDSKQIENRDPYYFDFEGYLFAFLSYKNIAYKKTEKIDPYLKRAVDKDLVLKLYEQGPCYLLDKGLYLYRNHSNGISTNSNMDKAYFWFWVVIINAAKRRNVNVEQLFLEKAMLSRREEALQNEIDSYNSSIVFKVMRKLKLFKI